MKKYLYQDKIKKQGVNLTVIIRAVVTPNLLPITYYLLLITSQKSRIKLYLK